VAVGDAGRGHVPESPAWFEGRYVCMMHIDGGQRAHLALSAHLARRSARGGAVGLCGQRPGEKSAREGQYVRVVPYLSCARSVMRVRTRTPSQSNDESIG